MFIYLFFGRQTEQYIRECKERIQSSGSPEVSQSLLSDLLSDSKLTTADIQRTLIDVFVGGIDSASGVSLIFLRCVRWISETVFFVLIFILFFMLSFIILELCRLISFWEYFNFLLKPIFMKPYYQIFLYFKTASSITILLFNLAKNLEKQDLLYDELEKHVPKFGPIDETILCNLNYLKACIKESMR